MSTDPALDVSARWRQPLTHFATAVTAAALGRAAILIHERLAECDQRRIEIGRDPRGRERATAGRETLRWRGGGRGGLTRKREKKRPAVGARAGAEPTGDERWAGVQRLRQMPPPFSLSHLPSPVAIECVRSALSIASATVALLDLNGQRANFQLDDGAHCAARSCTHDGDRLRRLADAARAADRQGGDRARARRSLRTTNLVAQGLAVPTRAFTRAGRWSVRVPEKWTAPMLRRALNALPPRRRVGGGGA